MKTLIAIVTGLLTFVGIFWGYGHLVSWIASGFSSSDGRLIIKILLWFFGFGLTLWISIIVGTFVAGLTRALLGK